MLQLNYIRENKEEAIERLAIKNFDAKAILEEVQLSFGHIVKTTIFLSDMQLFAQVNEVYGSYFSTDFPARETVAVKTLPRNVNVEISITAVVNL
jgi:2-iminobutanoate/2-iminopropanoate deaminase